MSIKAVVLRVLNNPLEQLGEESASLRFAFTKSTSASRRNETVSPSSISDIKFSFVSATNFFKTENFTSDTDVVASTGTQSAVLTSASATREQEISFSVPGAFSIMKQSPPCDSEIIYAGQKRKDRGSDDYVPAFKRLRSIIICPENDSGKTDDKSKSVSDNTCYIERRPTADQKSWLQNQHTVTEEDVFSMAIRDNHVDRQGDDAAPVHGAQYPPSNRSLLPQNSNMKTKLEPFRELLIKRDSGYHECEEHHDEVKSVSESPVKKTRSFRTPSPPPEREIIPESTLELRTITTVEDLFEELEEEEEEEEHVKEDIYKDCHSDEDDGRELTFVQ